MHFHTSKGYFTSPWSWTVANIQQAHAAAEEQNQTLYSFRVSTWWKQHRNTFSELRNHHYKRSNLLHILPCLFFSRCSSCKAGLLLFPLKCAGCMLDLIPEGSQWVAHGTPNPPSVCVHLLTVWESFHISDKYLAPQKKGEKGVQMSHHAEVWICFSQTDFRFQMQRMGWAWSATIKYLWSICCSNLIM